MVRAGRVAHFSQTPAGLLTAYDPPPGSQWTGTEADPSFQPQSLSLFPPSEKHDDHDHLIKCTHMPSGAEKSIPTQLNHYTDVFI